VGTDDEVGGRLSPDTDHSPFLAERIAWDRDRQNSYWNDKM
jgi:hypothetical protein